MSRKDIWAQAVQDVLQGRRPGYLIADKHKPKKPSKERKKTRLLRDHCTVLWRMREAPMTFEDASESKLHTLLSEFEYHGLVSKDSENHVYRLTYNGQLEAAKGPYYVYFLEAVGANRVKIGFSKDPKARLEALYMASPFPLRLLCAFEGGEQQEYRLQSLFREYEVHERWFERRGLLDTFLAMDPKAQERWLMKNVRSRMRSVSPRETESLTDPPTAP